MATAMGATITAIGTGIFLQHAYAANIQNQEHCAADLSGNGCVNTPGSGPNSMGTCPSGNSFGGSSCTSQTQLASPVPTQQGANTLTAHVHVVGGCNGEGAQCVGSNIQQYKDLK